MRKEQAFTGPKHYRKYEMKTITIEGKEYKVPNWVNWVAMDADGEWYGYKEKPVLGFYAGVWGDRSIERYFICHTHGWMNTLCSVEEITECGQSGGNVGRKI